MKSGGNGQYCTHACAHALCSTREVDSHERPVSSFPLLLLLLLLLRLAATAVVKVVVAAVAAAATLLYDCN